MEKMLSAKDVAGIIGFKDMDKARRVIRECVHMENPLRVSESALQEWIAGKSFMPGKTVRVEEFVDSLKRIPRRRGGTQN